MRESRTLEFKEQMTNSFLKTVSAFANYGTGEIKFGIKDDGSEVGVQNPKQVCLDIENKINDSIAPVPEYSLSINTTTSVVTLTVNIGLQKPYLYKSKAYKRNDSATIEVDRIELTRLILEGQNMNYEELPSKVKNLQFTVLEEKLKEHLKIEHISVDILKTLQLYTDKEGYNNAGEIIADNNNAPGIDIVRFGNSISIILDRINCSGKSILEQYDLAIDAYRKYYQYEVITGAIRVTKELIPEAAFREAVANALVHRVWDINASISIAMFEDHIEITSPGGLPVGISKENYLNGGISILRNPIIGNLFYRLRIIEHFGTGIRRINELYLRQNRKPQYTISDSSIKIVLPTITNEKRLTEDENIVFKLLGGRLMSSSEIVSESGFGKSKVLAILKRLESKGFVRTIGNGRGLKYTV